LPLSRSPKFLVDKADGTAYCPKKLGEADGEDVEQSWPNQA
jgi:hypothetical protein